MILCNICDAHIRWAYPTPRSQDTSILTYPCGSYPPWASGDAVTTLSPGVVTLQWEETVDHPGSAFRIAISNNEDFNYDCMVLADHIPHSEVWYPWYGFSSPKQYSYNVTIPNINCEKCSIQIFYVLAITLGSCCPYPGDPQYSCGSVVAYLSCANIKITGSEPAATYPSFNAGPSGAYTFESANWTEAPNNGSWWLEEPYPHYVASERCPNVPSGLLCANGTSLYTGTTGMVASDAASTSFFLCAIVALLFLNILLL